MRKGERHRQRNQGDQPMPAYRRGRQGGGGHGRLQSILARPQHGVLHQHGRRFKYQDPIPEDGSKAVFLDRGVLRERALYHGDRLAEPGADPYPRRGVWLRVRQLPDLGLQYYGHVRLLRQQYKDMARQPQPRRLNHDELYRKAHAVEKVVGPGARLFKHRRHFAKGKWHFLPRHRKGIHRRDSDGLVPQHESGNSGHDKDQRFSGNGLVVES